MISYRKLAMRVLGHPLRVPPPPPPPPPPPRVSPGDGAGADSRNGGRHGRTGVCGYLLHRRW